MKQFIPPVSVDEARERAQQLQDDIRMIEMQLTQKSISVRAGEKLPQNEYKELLEWQAKAKAAHTLKSIEYRKLKEWLRANNLRPMTRKELIENNGLNPNDPENLLLFLFDVVKNMLKDGAQISNDKQIVVDFVRSYFENKRVLYK